jgi:hypothetical protein
MSSKARSPSPAKAPAAGQAVPLKVAEPAPAAKAAPAAAPDAAEAKEKKPRSNIEAADVKPEEVGRKVFFGNLSYSTTEESLTAFGETVAPVCVSFCVWRS